MPPGNRRRMEGVAADRQQLHNINPNRPALPGGRARRSANMKYTTVIPTLLVTFAIPAWGDVVQKPDPWKSSEYSVIGVEGRFAVYIGVAPVILDAKLRNKNPKTYTEAIESFGPAFTSRMSSSGLWEWHFDDGKIYRVAPRWKSGLADKIELKLQDTYLQVLDGHAAKPTPPGAGQPASAPDSKHE